MAKKSLTPKGCTVHAIELKKSGRAEVRYRCKDDRGQKEYRKTNRKGVVVSTSNYPSKELRGIRTVRLPGGITVSGTANIHGFAACSREGAEITCHPK